MKFLSEKTYHLFFQISLWLKAAVTVGELAVGSLLVAISPQTLHRIVFSSFGGGATNQPHGFLVGHILGGVEKFVADQSFWAFIFLSHGFIKVFLLVGLLRNKLWAYPVAAIGFTGFVIYQTLQIMSSPSFLLEFITVLDVILVVLILHEYKHAKRIRAAQ